MKHLLTALALTVAAAGVFAADAAAPAASKQLTPQQQKMADCSAANKGKKGDDYKSAQKACLSGAPAAAAAPSAPLTQQQKMAACSKQNKGKKGDDYKSAQKACLAA
jgi:psiF repeat